MVRHYTIFLFAMLVSGFSLYTGIFGSLTPVLQRGFHVTLIIALIFLVHPSTKGGAIGRAVDLLLFVLIIAAGIYLYEAYQTINQRIGYLTIWDRIFGSLFIVILLEACRRVVGWPLTVIAGVFLA